MVTLLIASFFFIDALFIGFLLIAFLFFRVILVRLEMACLLVCEAFVHLSSETLPLVAHLVVHSSVLTFCIFLINFFFLALNVLLFQFIDNIFLFVAALLVFQVVHVKLVLQIVNISVFLDIHSVETLKLSFKTLIFFLILWLNIFETLHALIGSFKFLAPSRNFVLEFSLILS